MFENTLRVVIIRCDVSSPSSNQLDAEALVAGIQLDPCPETEYFGHVQCFLWRSYNTDIWTTVGDLGDEMQSTGKLLSSDIFELQNMLTNIA